MNRGAHIQFTNFANKYRGKFKQISAATRREYAPEDVEIEAWVLSKDWELKGIPISFGDPVYVDKLFAFLYSKLVRHTDKKVRTAVRLDHYAYGENPDSDSHPLMNRLAAAEENQPLQILLTLEAIAEQPPEPGPHDTRASAYLHLLRHYKGCMRDVANHLMISRSYCYYRFNEASEMVRRQCALPDTIGVSQSDFVPGPWRSFRLTRPWVQMELDLHSTADFWEGEGADSSRRGFPIV